jgi:glycosyltransferase involved in cell wall biosynthesis
MTVIDLSYLITTRNKLPYLREALGRLLAQAGSDEEIIVIDGGSTDGTVEFLTELYGAGRIHRFVTEQDRGEAHGFNKGLLMAAGELIKPLTDDDVFDYSAISACKKFMLDHPHVDVLGGNIANVILENPDAIEIVEESQAQYEAWRRGGGPVPFTGLSLMMRRSSLPFMGFFATNTPYPDTEFTLRITSMRANIAWCTAMIAVRIDNPHSNFRNLQMERRVAESDRMYYYYSDDYRQRTRQLPVAAARWMQRYLRVVRNHLSVAGVSTGGYRTRSIPALDSAPTSLGSVFTRCEAWLADYNGARNGAFLLPESPQFG